jgi:hypothetical protein
LLDGCSRKLLTLRVFKAAPGTKDMLALVKTAIAEYGSPRFLVTDRGPQLPLSGGTVCGCAARRNPRYHAAHGPRPAASRHPVLALDRNTLVLAGAARELVTSLFAPGLWAWDARVGNWRCKAIHYAEARRLLRAGLGAALTDDVLVPEELYKTAPKIDSILRAQRGVSRGTGAGPVAFALNSSFSPMTAR